MRLIIILLLCGTFSFGQNSFPTKYEITKDGFTDFTVISVEGKTKEEIYKKTIEWISKTYNSPKDVIKAEVENDYIRFQGVSKEKYCWDALVTFCNDIRYEVEVWFKDGKYKFEVLKLEDYYKDTKGFGSWSEVKYKDSWTHFKNTGEVRKMYADNVKQITAFFDELSKNLYDYIYNQNESAKSNDW